MKKIPPPPPVPPVPTYREPLPSAPLSSPRPLGDDPAERETIPHVLTAIEALLRQPRRLMYQLRQPEAGGLIRALLLAAVFCGLIYGLVIGTFSGGTQLWAAPVKIAGGLLVSALICLPSLYIFTCLSGSQARLAEVGGLLASMLVLMMVLLVGFAPVVWIFSQSTESLAWMGTLHLMFWFVATLFGVRFLKAGFSQSNARSQTGLNVWIVIFMLVALQMTTALRPIVGRADTFFPAKKEFFLGHWASCLVPPAARAGANAPAQASSSQP